ncbi:MAG: precorrin-8X methylmutase [Thermodesulforhabdaceae bacterium]
MMDIREIVPVGKSIEEESFRIIDEEIGFHGFDELHWPIVRRVIHTTGDFEFARLIHFHPEAISSCKKALRRGATIFVDTRMIAAGLSPRRLEKFGVEVKVPVSDPETHRLAKEWGVTRSVAAFRSVGRELDGSIVAVGNAPTALIEIVRLVEEGVALPSLVVGVPVGFVQAVESKKLLREISFVPSITVEGRKGGSPVAVAMLHGLMDVIAEKF